MRSSSNVFTIESYIQILIILEITWTQFSHKYQNESFKINLCQFTKYHGQTKISSLQIYLGLELDNIELSTIFILML